jgi:hypothetical protein
MLPFVLKRFGLVLARAVGVTRPLSRQEATRRITFRLYRTRRVRRDPCPARGVTNRRVAVEAPPGAAVVSGYKSKSRNWLECGRLWGVASSGKQLWERGFLERMDAEDL